MKLLSENRLRELVFGFFMWAILVLFQGYQIGTETHSEFLSYSVHLKESTILTNDLFIQSIKAAGWNEHMVSASILSFFYPFQETIVLILHILATVGIVIGMLRLCSHFIQNTYLSYTVVLLTLLISYNANTGGDEMWRNSLQGASIAKALGIWAIVLVLSDKIVKGTALTMASTLLEPIIGLHLFLLFIPVFIYQVYVSQRVPLFEAILSVFFYVLCAGVFIWSIRFSQGEQALASIANTDYISLVYKFRHPEFYHPLHFSKQGILLMLFLIPIGLVYFHQKDQRVFVMLMTIVFGTFIYIGGLYQDSMLIISSWWFRTMIWAKLLGFIAVAGLLEKHFLKRSIKENKRLEVFVIGSACLAAGMLFSIFQEALPGDKPYHFSSSNLRANPETDIALQIREKTPKNAVFIQPLEFTALKYYGKRASYVDFQTLPKRRDYLPTWKQRLKEVYNIHLDLPEKGPQLKKPAYAGLISLDEDGLMRLKAKGVTHLLTYKEHHLHLRIVAGNDIYKVYEL
ncbi:DUF6798 domain-containing protein [Cytophagaceae bacterium ABcell3]|nr:DUF6798 domain-containing protein [Cytophagaceae bacterium ABcell3]